MGCQRTLSVRLVCLGARGCASSGVLIMEMRCIWSLSATAWQICVSSLRTWRQTMQQFMWQPDMLQVAKFLDAGVKRMQEINPDAGSNL